MRSVCHSCGWRRPAVSEEVRCPTDGSWLVDVEAHERHPDDPLLGTVVADRYAVVGWVGAGGMGAVYRAIQQPVGREVALKVVRDRAGREEDLARFRREAALVASLTHPNIVTLHDFGVHEGLLYMALELIRGVLLQHAIGGKPMAPERAARIVAGILDALAEPHGLGLVHRDLKPANVMLARTPWGAEAVRVLDFGIAKATEGPAAADHDVTGSGVAIGTVRYMSPEQARAEHVDGRSDLYSVGAMAYECLTGRPPFPHANHAQLLWAQCHEPPPPIDPALGIPAGLVDATMRALSKSADARFADAATMAWAVRDAVGLAAPDGVASMLSGEAVTVADSPGLLPVSSGTSQEAAAELVASPASGGSGRVLLVAGAVGVVASMLVAGVALRRDGEPVVAPAPTSASAPASAPAPASASASAPEPASASAPPPVPAPADSSAGRDAGVRVDGGGRQAPKKVRPKRRARKKPKARAGPRRQVGGIELPEGI